MGRNRTPEQEVSRRWIWRWGMALAAATAAAGLGLFAMHRTEGFLMRDSRFVFSGPQEAGEESRNLRVEGVNHASRTAVLRVFDPDYGKSIYLVPIGERRRNLLAVNWVRDATVSRVWPNEVHVRVSERTPIAFVQIPNGRGQGRRPGLIDADGVLLEIDNPDQYRLPVLTGLRANHNEAERRLRARRVLRLMDELGPRAEQVSEINGSDPENLKLTMSVGNRAVVLLVGNRRFRQKVDNFYRHLNEVRLRAPEAATFDLRLEDRITVIPGSPEEGGAIAR